VSVVRFKFRCNILTSGKIIKEMSGSVASGTPYTVMNKTKLGTDLTLRSEPNSE